MIRLGTNLYNSNDDTDDELILGNDLIGYSRRVTVQSSSLGPLVDKVNLPSLKVVIKAKKKLLERQKGKRHLITLNIPRVGQ